jgi:hypothetical protein
VLECPEDANEDDHYAQHSKSDRVEQCWTERSQIERTQAPARFFCVEFVSVDHTESTRRDRPRGEREVIDPKWNIRFRDLCEWHIIKAKCFSCGHVGTLYPNRLKKLRLAQSKRRHRWLASSSEDHLRADST